MTFNNLGQLLQGRRATNALEMFDRSMEHHRAALARRRQNTTFARQLAAVIGNAAFIEQFYKRDEKALRMYQEAIEILKKLATENPAVPIFQRDLYAKYFDTVATIPG